MAVVEIREHAAEQVFCLIIPEQVAENDTQAYLDRFAQALATDQPFGVIFAYAGGKPRKTRAGELLERAWLKQHRAAVSRLSFGIAMVANPSIFSLLSKIMIKGVGPRMFGCPCTLVNSIDDAHAWLRAQRLAHSPASAAANQA